MKIVCAQLTGVALDWAVLRAIRPDLEWKLIDGELHTRWPEKLLGILPKDWMRLAPSTVHAQGGPLLDRFAETLCKRQGAWSVEVRDLRANFIVEGKGPTALIATMRGIAIAYHGYEVDVPDSLTSSCAGARH